MPGPRGCAWLGGAWSREAAWSWRVPGPGGCLVREGVPGPRGVWSGGASPGGVPGHGGLVWGRVWRPPGMATAVGILLECILVYRI